MVSRSPAKPLDSILLSARSFAFACAAAFFPVFPIFCGSPFHQPRTTGALRTARPAFRFAAPSLAAGRQVPPRRATIMGKGPSLRPGPFAARDENCSNISAMPDERLGRLLGRRQFRGQREFRLVPQDAELDAGCLVVLALRRELLAQLTHPADSFAINGGDHVSRSQASLLRR